MVSLLGHWHPLVRAGTLEGSEKGPKEVTVGLRERERRLEDLVGLKKGKSSGCVKMAWRKSSSLRAGKLEGWSFLPNIQSLWR